MKILERITESLQWISDRKASKPWFKDGDSPNMMLPLAIIVEFTNEFGEDFRSKFSSLVHRAETVDLTDFFQKSSLTSCDHAASVYQYGFDAIEPNIVKSFDEVIEKLNGGYIHCYFDDYTFIADEIGFTIREFGTLNSHAFSKISELKDYYTINKLVK